MNCFVNYIEYLSDSKDTAHKYPKNLKKLRKYEKVNISTNEIKLNKYIIGVMNRASKTRFHRYFKNLSNKSLLPIRKIYRSDICYFSYVYPFRPYLSILSNSVIRVNYQTDRVLDWRNTPDISKYRDRRGSRLGSFNCVMTTTKHSVEKIKKYLPSGKTNVKYCPNFLPYLKSSNKNHVRRNESEIKLLFVGGDGHRKGLENLLKAINRIGKMDKSKISLTVVSEYDYESEVESVKVSKHDRLSREKILKLMESSDVFCMPTKSDSYGIVFVEAMSKGCAILSDDDTTRKEIVEENEVGICVDPNDIGAITESIEELVRDDESRQEYKENALSVFRKKFSPEVVAEMHYDIFQSVISSGHD